MQFRDSIIVPDRLRLGQVAAGGVNLYGQHHGPTKEWVHRLAALVAWTKCLTYQAKGIPGYCVSG